MKKYFVPHIVRIDTLYSIRKYDWSQFKWSYLGNDNYWWHDKEDVLMWASYKTFGAAVDRWSAYKNSHTRKKDREALNIFIHKNDILKYLK